MIFLWEIVRKINGEMKKEYEIYKFLVLIVVNKLMRVNINFFIKYYVLYFKWEIENSIYK